MKAKRIALVIVVLIIAIWVLTGVYIVHPNEEGVIRRWGKYRLSVGPGIYYHIPWPVERVDKPKITKIEKIEIGYRTIREGPPAVYKPVEEESLMLTGDMNIVELWFIVQYRIKDARDYLFNVRNVKKTIKDAAEASMRQIIGDRGIDEALTIGKEEIQDKTEEKLQQILDLYKSGIDIVTVKLQDVHAPGEVKKAFEAVASAKEARERLINEALGKYNEQIPKAKGEAEKTIREAEAYAVQRIKEAEGNAHRFLARLKEYKKAKSVTKDRLYLETMEDILPEIEKIVMPRTTEGFIKFLNLRTSSLGEEIKR
ncbi:FtsH protease activity modulator HflK [Candidatus Aerophobetes bacterium]|nr:FtsH protease activity modulator HflK [Candidatus Aerophobetes bacterium]